MLNLRKAENVPDGTGVGSEWPLKWIMAAFTGLGAIVTWVAHWTGLRGTVSNNSDAIKVLNEELKIGRNQEAEFRKEMRVSTDELNKRVGKIAVSVGSIAGSLKARGLDLDLD